MKFHYVETLKSKFIVFSRHPDVENRDDDDGASHFNARANGPGCTHKTEVARAELRRMKGNKISKM